MTEYMTYKSTALDKRLDKIIARYGDVMYVVRLSYLAKYYS